MARRLPSSFRQQTAVAAGLLGLETQHGDGSAAIQLGDKTRQGIGLDEGVSA